MVIRSTLTATQVAKLVIGVTIQSMMMVLTLLVKQLGRRVRRRRVPRLWRRKTITPIAKKNGNRVSTSMVKRCWIWTAGTAHSQHANPHHLPLEMHQVAPHPAKYPRGQIRLLTTKDLQPQRLRPGMQVYLVTTRLTSMTWDLQVSPWPPVNR
jgi:hypothetical protein